MKIALLGTGFGQAHAAVYAQYPDVDEVIVFGLSPEKLARVAGEFGFATSTDLDALLADGSVDLVDICLPTRLHADVAIRAMQAGKHVLIELPLAVTLDDARRIVASHQATGQMAFVDMLSRFSRANQYLSQTVADQRYGHLTVLEIEGRTALLWPGYDLDLDTLGNRSLVGAIHRGTWPSSGHRSPRRVAPGRSPVAASVVAAPKIQHPQIRHCSRIQLYLIKSGGASSAAFTLMAPARHRRSNGSASRTVRVTFSIVPGDALILRYTSPRRKRDVSSESES